MWAVMRPMGGAWTRVLLVQATSPVASSVRINATSATRFSARSFSTSAETVR